MKKILITFLLFTAEILLAQNEIDWDGKYQLQISDFQSAASQIGEVKNYSLYNSCGPEFSFFMSNAEFIFTRNFNSKINNTFKRNSSALVAPDNSIAEDLVAFAQYQFNLSELYARKLRKKIFEEKATFSSVNSFKPIYEEIQKDFSKEVTNAGKETDLGRAKDKLKVLEENVMKQLQELSDYCKECKPKKKKK